MNDPTTKLVPDRSAVATEQRNPRSMNLHELSAAQIVKLIAAEDRRVVDAMDRAGDSLTALIEAAEPRFCSGGRLIYLGAGTSGRLGVLDASEAPPTFQVEVGRVVGIIAGGDASLRRSSESREDDEDGARADLAALNLTERDTVIGIAAGGSTPYVLGGLAIAREICGGCLRGLIVCSPRERPAWVDHLVVLETGPEVIAGSTRMKAGTATKLALNTISTTLMVRSGRVHENLMVDVRATNEKLRDRAARIVATLTGLNRAAAFEVLDRAGGAVKTAVVMQRRSVDRQQAEALLAKADGRLHRALNERA
jgi:N-acetylmuramic acid 6-phosphate etherase